MNPAFRHWLGHQQYDRKTIQNHIAQATRVEEYYGSLDDHYSRDRLESLVETFEYSANDERQGRSNPSNIPILGDLRTNLTAYKSSVRRFCEFKIDERE